MIRLKYSFVITLIILLSPIKHGVVDAAFLQQRSVKLSTSVSGSVSTHTLSFNVTTSNSIGSILFEYCANDPLVGTACNAPVGLSLSGASLVTQTGETGFSISNVSTVNKLVLTRIPIPTTPGIAEFVVSGVINPSDSNRTTYVRMSTYSSIDATGTYIDGGGSAFSTAGNFGAAAYVPPVLSFCAAISVELNCSSYGGSQNSFGEFSVNQTKSLTSEFAVGTNDPTGYRVYIIGNTMTSGNNIIEPMTTRFNSIPGTSQFGINLRDNNFPDVGANIIGTGVGLPTSDYNVTDQYKYIDGDILAEATQASEYNKFTVSYIVNINSNQRSGSYASTFTFLAIAQF